MSQSDRPPRNTPCSPLVSCSGAVRRVLSALDWLPLFLPALLLLAVAVGITEPFVIEFVARP